MIAKLAWKNIWFKPLNTILSVVLLTSSVAIITTLVLVEKQFEEKFSSNIDGVDLVLGATEKFKITDYLNELSKNDRGEVHSCEIEEADFYVGSYCFESINSPISFDFNVEAKTLNGVLGKLNKKVDSIQKIVNFL